MKLFKHTLASTFLTALIIVSVSYDSEENAKARGR